MQPKQAAALMASKQPAGVTLSRAIENCRIALMNVDTLGKLMNCHARNAVQA